MIHKEAIKVLRWALNRLEGHHYITDDYGTVDPSAKVNAFGMAIEALEKQIPKKPKRYIAFDGIERNGCPACPKNEILYAGQKFCSVCGQAIDWSVGE